MNVTASSLGGQPRACPAVSVEHLFPAERVHAALERQVILETIQHRGAGCELHLRGAVLVCRLHLRLLEQRHHVVLLVVGHPDARAGHPSLCERDRSRGAHDAVAAAEGRTFSGEHEAVARRELDGAGELQVVLVLASLRFTAGEDEITPAAAADVDSDSDELGGPSS